MVRRKMLLIASVSVLALASCGPNAGQLEEQAVNAMDGGQIKEAKILMDQSLALNADRGAETEFNTARIATAYYEQFERDQRESPARIQAMRAYIHLFQSGAIKDHQDEAREKLSILATSLYEDLLFSLNTSNYVQSQEDFDLYRIAMALAQPDFDISEAQSSYFMILASVYMQLTETDPEHKADHLNAACETYQKVLDLDPENVSANYNLGMTFFKTSLDLADETAASIGLERAFSQGLASSELVPLYRNLESSNLDGKQLAALQNSFRKSIPYLETVYKNDPSEFISNALLLDYFSVNDQEKYEAIREELMSSEGISL